MPLGLGNCKDSQETDVLLLTRVITICWGKKKKKALSISLQLLGNIQRLEQDLYKAAAIKYLCVYMYIKKNICVYREKMCNGAFVYLAITLPYFLFIYLFYLEEK